MCYLNSVSLQFKLVTVTLSENFWHTINLPSGIKIGSIPTDIQGRAVLVIQRSWKDKRMKETRRESVTLCFHDDQSCLLWRRRRRRWQQTVETMVALAPTHTSSTSLDYIFLNLLENDDGLYNNSDWRGDDSNHDDGCDVRDDDGHG